MNNDPTKSSAPDAADPSALNNLVEFISGTSAAIESIRAGAAVDRAGHVTVQPDEQAAGSDKKVLFHPDFGAMSRQKSVAPPAIAKKRSLLVVDDEPMALVLAKRVLSEAGFEVETAQSGFECLDRFRKRPRHFDLVLLDLSMPFMDGEETFYRLKSIRAGAVVLISTGFIAQERLDKMTAAGMAGFLRKPHRPNELVANIEAILERLKMSQADCTAGPQAAGF